MISAQLLSWRDFVNASAHEHGLESTLVFGVMQIESGGRNIIGDGGHGRGLMQIDDRSHAQWLAAHSSGLDPESNIDYGCAILRADIDYFKGDVRAGVAAYNCGPGNAAAGQRESGNPDKYTTGGNYSTRVLEQAAQFKRDLENMVLIPQKYVDQFNLPDAYDVQALIDNFEGVVQTAREEGYAKGLGDCEHSVSGGARM